MAELTDDRIEELFTDLRVAHLHRVRPPGAATARATVRRRRHNASVAVGVAMAGATAAGMVGILPAGGMQDGPARPPLSHHVLETYRNAAASAIGIDYRDQVKRELSGQLVLTTEHHETHPVVAGTYQLRMSCMGTGTATVTFRQRETKDSTTSRPDDTQIIDSTVVPCVQTAASQTLDIVVTQDVLYVDVMPDDDAEGASGFAYKAELSQMSMQELRMGAAEALDLPAGEVANTTYFLNGSVNDDYSTLEIGKYRLDVACLGAGSVNVEVKLSRPGSGLTAIMFSGADCRSFVDITPVPVQVEDRGYASSMTVTLVPDRAATRQAAVALRLVQE